MFMKTRHTHGNLHELAASKISILQIRIRQEVSAEKPLVGGSLLQSPDKIGAIGIQHDHAENPGLQVVCKRIEKGQALAALLKHAPSKIHKLSLAFDANSMPESS